MKVKLVSADGKHEVEVEPVDAKEMRASGYTEAGKEPKKEVVTRGKRKNTNGVQTNPSKATD